MTTAEQAPDEKSSQTFRAPWTAYALMGGLGGIPLALMIVILLRDPNSFISGGWFDGLLITAGMFVWMISMPWSARITLAADELTYRWFDGVRLRRGTIKRQAVAAVEDVHFYGSRLPPTFVHVWIMGKPIPHKVALGALQFPDVGQVRSWLHEALDREQTA